MAMERRPTAARMAVLLLTAAFAAGEPQQPQPLPLPLPLPQQLPRNPSQPHIFMYMADDLAHSTLGVAGNTLVKSPAIDAFARGGIQFERMYTTMSMCAPSRTSALTGLYPVRNGVFRNHGATLATATTLPVYLQRENYVVALGGKDHTMPDSLYPYDIMLNSPRVNGLSMEETVAAIFAEAQTRLRAAPAHGAGDDAGTPGAAAPLCLLYNSFYPHPPYDDTDAEYLPASAAIPHPKFVDNAYTRWRLNMYYHMIHKLDEEFAGFLRAVKAAVHPEDPYLVVFTSDHGGLPFATMSKYSTYDEGLRVPFFVQGNAVGFGERGGRVRQPLSFVDILPTFIDIAGGTVPAEGVLDGRSFRGLLEGSGTGPDEAGRNPALSARTWNASGPAVHAYVFGMHTNRGIVCATSPYPSRMVTDGSWKYIRNYNHRYVSQNPAYACFIGPGVWSPYRDILMNEIGTKGPQAAWAYHSLCRPPEELYNLDRDPLEENNLLGPAVYAPKAQELRAALETWMQAQGDIDPVGAEASVPFRVQPYGQRLRPFNLKADIKDQLCSEIKEFVPAALVKRNDVCRRGIEYNFSTPFNNTKCYQGFNRWAPNLNECTHRCYNDDSCKGFAWGARAVAGNCFMYTNTAPAVRYSVKPKEAWAMYVKQSRCAALPPTAALGVPVCPQGIQLNFSEPEQGNKGRYAGGRGFISKAKTSTGAIDECAGLCLLNKECFGFSWSATAAEMTNCILLREVATTGGGNRDPAWALYRKENNCPAPSTAAAVATTPASAPDPALCQLGAQLDFDPPILDAQGRFAKGAGYLGKVRVGTGNFDACALLCVQRADTCRGVSFHETVEAGGNCVMHTKEGMSGDRRASVGWRLYARSEGRCKDAAANAATAAGTKVAATAVPAATFSAGTQNLCTGAVLGHFTQPRKDVRGAFAKSSGHLVKIQTKDSEACAAECIQRAECRGFSWLAAQEQDQGDCILLTATGAAKPPQVVAGWWTYVQRDTCEPPALQATISASAIQDTTTVVADETDSQSECTGTALGHFTQPRKDLRGAFSKGSGYLVKISTKNTGSEACAAECVQRAECRGFSLLATQEQEQDQDRGNCILLTATGAAKPPQAVAGWWTYVQQDTCKPAGPGAITSASASSMHDTTTAVANETVAMAAPAEAQNPCTGDVLGHFTQPRKDFRGAFAKSSGHLVKIQTKDSEACAAECIQRAECRGFSWLAAQEQDQGDCILLTATGAAKPPQDVAGWWTYVQRDTCEPAGTPATTSMARVTALSTTEQKTAPHGATQSTYHCKGPALAQFSAPVLNRKGRKYANAQLGDVPGNVGLIIGSWQRVPSNEECAAACLSDVQGADLCEGFAWKEELHPQNTANCIFFNRVALTVPPTAAEGWNFYALDEQCRGSSIGGAPQDRHRRAAATAWTPGGEQVDTLPAPAPASSKLALILGGPLMLLVVAVLAVSNARRKAAALPTLPAPEQGGYTRKRKHSDYPIMLIPGPSPSKGRGGYRGAMHAEGDLLDEVFEPEPITAPQGRGSSLAQRSHTAPDLPV